MAPGERAEVHQVERQHGRVTFDIDPAATGLVLREAWREAGKLEDWLVVKHA